MGTLLDEVAPHVPADRLIISGAAGIPTSFFEERLASGTPVVRVMTNTPALVDEAMSVISAGTHATADHLAHAEEIFGAVGKTLRVPESQQDACTALSGSGPAYFYYLVEAMTDAGILLGLPRDKAHDLIVQSAIGAATMLRDSGEHPVKLRENAPPPPVRPSTPSANWRTTAYSPPSSPRSKPPATAAANSPPATTDNPELTRPLRVRTVLRVVRRERGLRSVPGRPSRKYPPAFDGQSI
ncbi:Pyrroline-5-carboxylate reductase [Streptomyces fumanus]